MPGSEPGPEEPRTDFGRRPLPSSRPPRPRAHPPGGLRLTPSRTCPHLSPCALLNLFLPVARLTRYHCYSGQAFAGSFGPQWIAEQIYPSRDETGQRNRRERAVRARPPCPPWNICGPAAAVSMATTTECPDAGPDISSLRCLWPPPCDLGDILLKRVYMRWVELGIFPPARAKCAWSWLRLWFWWEASQAGLGATLGLGARGEGRMERSYPPPQRFTWRFPRVWTTLLLFLFSW